MSKLGSRYNQGKSPLSYVLQFGNAISGVATVGAFGAMKYARNNYKKGLSHTEIADSMMRHLAAYLCGEEVDPESGLPHVDHVAWNGLALAEMVRLHPELDDREGKTNGKDDG